MLRVRRRCAQTAHISLHSSNFQRAIIRQNFQRALNFSASSKTASSDFPNFRSDFHLRFRPSPSLFRFGEAVFTDGHRKPQEQKTPAVTFFRLPVLHAKSRGWTAQHHKTNMPRTEKPPERATTRVGFRGALLLCGKARRHQGRKSHQNHTTPRANPDRVTPLSQNSSLTEVIFRLTC